MSKPSYAAPASDNAGDAAYVDGWQQGDNGGFGFMPWVLEFTGEPADLEQPHFIDVKPLPFNALGSPAFGLTTTMQDTSAAYRSFIAPLAIGETLQIDIDGSAFNPLAARFSAGNVIQLFTGNDVERFGIFTNNGYAGNNWVATGDVNTQLPAGNAFRFEFKLESTNTYDFVMRPLGGGAPFFSQNDAVLEGTPGSGLSRLRIASYENGGSATGEFELFFNNLQVLPRPPSDWNVDSDGNWSSAANWTAGIPNGAGAWAVFGNIIAAQRTVTVNIPITVGQINFDSSNSYTIAGSNAVTLDASTGAAQLIVSMGSHTLGAPVVLADKTVISVTGAEDILSITGALSANGRDLTKNGAGTLQVNNIMAAALTVASGIVTIQPNGGNTGTSVVNTLDVNGTGRLDLNDNDLVIRATAATKDDVYTAIEADITSAQNGFDANFVTKWDGPGLASSTARTANVGVGLDLTGLGVIRNSDLDVITGVPGSTYSSFSGQPVMPDDVLVKYTYTGDGNLDGAVTFDDYAAMDAAFFGTISNLGWATGDINFDGVINFDDYAVVDRAFFLQGAPLSGEIGTVAVPEPASQVLFLTTVAFVLVIQFRPWQRA